MPPLKILTEVRACTHCEPHLPLGARPLVQGSGVARILIIGQAPGRRTHEKGIPWDDVSGDRLRTWLGVERETFYDPRVFAHMPMGLCFPGTGTNGDLPPREECAPLWHDRLLKAFRRVELTLYVGRFALARYLPAYKTITDACAAYDKLLPDRLALPHPSPRNKRWMTRNTWFDADVLPRLRERIDALIGR